MSPERGNANPLVSVVMATLNRAHLLPRAIRSLLGQSYPDWELIVIDDGSTDGSEAVVEQLAAGDPRVRCQWQPNAGLSVARNAGLAVARGEHLTFLDSDDEYKPDHLALRARLLQAQPDVDMIHGGVAIVGGPDRVPDRHNPSILVPLSDCVIGGTFYMRRKVVEALGGFRQPDYGTDAEFMERAAELFRIEKVDCPTYVYHRDTPDGMCNVMEQKRR